MDEQVFQEFKERVLAEFEGVKDAQTSISNDIRCLKKELQDMKLQFVEGRGLLKGGKLLAGIVGGVISWIASMAFYASRIWENKS